MDIPVGLEVSVFPLWIPAMAWRSSVNGRRLTHRCLAGMDFLGNGRPFRIDVWLHEGGLVRPIKTRVNLRGQFRVMRFSYRCFYVCSLDKFLLKMTLGQHKKMSQ